jgi:dephospho-CoA kinase
MVFPPDMTKATPFRVGLTGGIGSGKSTVANLFVALGASLVDTDVIAHAMTAPGGAAMPAIRASFGDGFVAADGSMDRVRMRAHVFAEPAAKKTLESILHPLIRSETARQVASAQGAYCLLAIPLLVEGGDWKSRVERVLVIDCEEDTQVKRVMARSQLAEAEVRRIMAAQASRAARLAAADDVLVNEGPLDKLHSRVAQLHQAYVDLAALRAHAA